MNCHHGIKTPSVIFHQYRFGPESHSAHDLSRRRNRFNSSPGDGHESICGGGTCGGSKLRASMRSGIAFWRSETIGKGSSLLLELIETNTLGDCYLLSTKLGSKHDAFTCLSRHEPTYLFSMIPTFVRISSDYISIAIRSLFISLESYQPFSFGLPPFFVAKAQRATRREHPAKGSHSAFQL